MLKYTNMHIIVIFLIFTANLFPVNFYYDNNKIEVPIIEKENVTYYDLKTILGALNLSIDPYREGKSFQILYMDGKLIFGIDSPFIILNDKIQEIPNPPILFEDKIYIPFDFLAGPLSQLLNSAIKIQGKNLILEEKIKKQAPTLYNLEIHHIGFTKLVLYFTENVSYFIKEGPNQFTVELPKNISFLIQSLKLDDPFISSVSYKGNFLIVSLKIENWSISHYTLGSPFRIIIDITNKKKKVEEREEKGFRVIIDPGHGGSDFGATGLNGTKEKDITLRIALYLKEILKNKGFNPILTRENDIDLSIEERANFANSNKGSLFLSIHNNSFKTYKIRGSETYYLSIEPFEEIYKPLENQPANIDLILWDLAQSKYLKDSAYFAELLQKELDELWEIPPRGIKQAPLKILSSVTMPACLVEIGFLSNPEEESLLGKDDFLLKIAQAISRAILTFKETVGKRWENLE